MDDAQLRSIIIANSKASETRFISVKNRREGEISETCRYRGVCCSGNCWIFITSLRVMNLMRISRWSKVDTKWYLGVCCRKCGAPILFALDHSDGEVQPVPA